MADRYLNLALGSGGTGTANDPFGSGTVSGWGVALATGDRIIAWGHGQQNYINLGDLSGIDRIRLIQYEGQTQALIDGARRIAAWTNTTGSVWTPTTGNPGSKPGGIIANRSSTLQSDGSYMPWLEEDTGAAVPGDVGAGQWAWLSNVLYVHLPGGANPNSSDVGWSPANGTVSGGVYAEDATGLLVEGIHVANLPGDTADTGYGINITNATGCVLRGCQSWDTGNKGMGFHGTACSACVIDQCKVHAVDGGPAFITHSTVGAVSAVVSGCYAVARTRGYTTGVRATANGCQFSLVHGAGGVASVEYRSCRAVGINGYDCGGISSSDNFTASPTDVDNWRAYPVRVSDFRATGLSANGSINTPTAFRRSSIEYTYAGGVSGNVFCVQIGNAAADTIAGPHHYLFEGCALSWDGNSATDNVTRLVELWNPAYLRLNNTTLREFGDGTNGTVHQMIRYRDANSTARTIARRSVFAFRATASTQWLCHGNATAPPTTAFDFFDCWYKGIGTGQYSRTANRQTQAEWAANVDVPGVYEVDPGFASNTGAVPSGSGQLAKRRVYSAGGANRRGVGNARLGHRYGGTVIGRKQRKLWRVDPCNWR